MRRLLSGELGGVIYRSVEGNCSKRYERFWDYCAERRVLINNLTLKNLFKLNGGNANLKITGDASNVSNLYLFDWFEWCYFQDRSPFPY